MGVTSAQHPERADSQKKREALHEALSAASKRCGARVGRNSVCKCGGRWRDSRGVGAGECHTEPAMMPVGVARLILLSRSEAR